MPLRGTVDFLQRAPFETPVLYYYGRDSCRGVQTSWSSFPQSSSGNPCLSGNLAAPPGCRLGDCRHDGVPIWSLGCGRQPALGLSKGLPAIWDALD